MVWQTQFDRLPIREVDDLLEREAVDFHANRLWSDARGKQRRRYLRQTFIFAQRDGKHRQVQLRLLLPRQTMMESIPAGLKGLRRRSVNSNFRMTSCVSARREYRDGKNQNC